ncbi:LytR/AlgR family response regulator transcription factor [Tunicatimonas pelagia]|uniref:LytR/AlgR family response regulator transcription factor n=1 Tax=Tunicatimonas pelagia TaxID=931531 RepID=UPI0026655F8C|nr:LytTR family DNA-binding domain-containing protein [Tunicatimonas pelagia]WKN42747.1 LytTR family DNA-binding domain-containing protein [Tunicatimonas pelagia]
MIRCVAVDDEPLALNLVQSYIEKVPFLTLVEACESAYEAMDLLSDHPIDLILLDINMPDLSGIQFVKTLSHPPAVIFTTAYEQYALEGYELNVVDYLLKPFSFERFLKAVNKVKPDQFTTSTAKASSNQTPLPAPQTDSASDYMLVRVEHNIVKVSLNDILYIEGYKDYVKVYTTTEKPLLTIKSMKDVEGMLSGKGFIRVHRSYIVALNKIDSLRNNRIMVHEKNIPVGETYREQFYEKFIEGKL